MHPETDHGSLRLSSGGPVTGSDRVGNPSDGRWVEGRPRRCPRREVQVRRRCRLGSHCASAVFPYWDPRVLPTSVETRDRPVRHQSCRREPLHYGFRDAEWTPPVSWKVSDSPWSDGTPSLSSAVQHPPYLTDPDP